MITNAAFKNIVNSCGTDDNVVVATQQDYYNESSYKTKNVKDVIKENGKLILLIDE